MKVRDIMTRDIATAELDTSLETIAAMMRDQDTGAIPVLEDGELAGIVTDRDIVVRCVAEGKDPSDATAEDVLSEDLVTVSPDDDTEKAIELMSRRQIRRLPVVEQGRLVGMLSLGDISVKTGEDEATGEALENISEGVKASGRTAKTAARKSSPAARPEPARPQTGSGPARPTQHAIPEREPKNKGQAARREQASKAPQGIANRSAGEERSRQARVLSIREQNKSTSKRRAG